MAVTKKGRTALQAAREKMTKAASKDGFSQVIALLEEEVKFLLVF